MAKELEIGQSVTFTFLDGTLVTGKIISLDDEGYIMVEDKRGFKYPTKKKYLRKYSK